MKRKPKRQAQYHHIRYYSTHSTRSQDMYRHSTQYSIPGHISTLGSVHVNQAVHISTVLSVQRVSLPTQGSTGLINKTCTVVIPLIDTNHIVKKYTRQLTVQNLKYYVEKKKIHPDCCNMCCDLFQISKTKLVDCANIIAQ